MYLYTIENKIAMKTTEEHIKELIPFDDFNRVWKEVHTYDEDTTTVGDYDDLFWIIQFYSQEELLVPFVNEFFAELVDNDKIYRYGNNERDSKRSIR